MSDAIRVNGFCYSWGSLIFRLDGERYYGFTAVSFGDKREHGIGWSMARHHAPYLRSSGKYSAEPLKVTGWKRSVLALKQAIAAKSSDGKSYGNVTFQGVLQFFEGDETEVNIEFNRLVWAANNSSHEESADPLKADFELQCMYISENGLTLFDASDGLP